MLGKIKKCGVALCATLALAGTFIPAIASGAELNKGPLICRAAPDMPEQTYWIGNSTKIRDKDMPNYPLIRITPEIKSSLADTLMGAKEGSCFVCFVTGDPSLDVIYLYQNQTNTDSYSYSGTAYEVNPNGIVVKVGIVGKKPLISPKP